MNDFEDGEPIYDFVETLETPIGGLLSFSPAAFNLDSDPSYWVVQAVYNPSGETTVTLGLPEGTGAFFFYAQPNIQFQNYSITATAEGGTTIFTSPPFEVQSPGLPQGWGFYSYDIPLASITVNSTETYEGQNPSDLIIGQFGIAAGDFAPVPEPSTVFTGIGLLGVLATQMFKFKRTKGQNSQTV
ncbi:MAG: hypothetical protein AB9869_34350 [Verrucomicrobiia bacterium]